jgi:predicted phosphodiesterase
MRVAVLSDIHGNALALEVALADLKKSPTDALVCLGDAIQSGPQPARVVARLRELECPVVMGNADDWMLTGIETGAENISPERQKKMAEVRAWSLSNLSDADRAFIAAFQPTVTIPLSESKKLLCYHGSPKSYDDIMLPDSSYETFEKLLGGDASTIYCGGHTHVQFLRRVGDAFHFNPGSIGFAYNHHQPEDDVHYKPIAEYAILTVEGETISLEFRTVPYDANALIEIYRTSGRPYAEEMVKQYGG